MWKTRQWLTQAIPQNFTITLVNILIKKFPLFSSLSFSPIILSLSHILSTETYCIPNGKDDRNIQCKQLLFPMYFMWMLINSWEKKVLAPAIRQYIQVTKTVAKLWHFLTTEDESNSLEFLLFPLPFPRLREKRQHYFLFCLIFSGKKGMESKLALRHWSTFEAILKYLFQKIQTSKLFFSFLDMSPS